MAIAIQARITGALKIQLDDSMLAAMVTFGSGLVLMLIVTMITPANRRALVRMLSGAITGRFPPVYLFTGLLGAFGVFSQGATVDLIGVALFSLVFIGGQMVASAVLDSVGWVPAGRTKLGVARLVGIAMAMAGLLMALSVRLQAGPADGGENLMTLLIPLLVVFTGGLLQPPQMAMNGVVNIVAGRPEPLVLFNYLTGTAVLALLAWPAIAAGGLSHLPLAPGDWWYYTGGLLGSIVVIGGALLTRTIGSLLFTMGLIAGQVSSALLMDALWPTPGAVIGWQTVVGGILTVLALFLASGSSRRY